jgi:hypothetical protein
LAIAEHIAQQLREPCTARPSQPLDVVAGGMDAMRRGDLDEVKRWLGPDVELRGQLVNVFRVGCGRIIAAKAPRWA